MPATIAAIKLHGYLVEQDLDTDPYSIEHRLNTDGTVSVSGYDMDGDVDGGYDSLDEWAAAASDLLEAVATCVLSGCHPDDACM
jgi:hypothetical protein